MDYTGIINFNVNDRGRKNPGGYKVALDNCANRLLVVFESRRWLVGEPNAQEKGV
jgi:hypothetical protein